MSRSLAEYEKHLARRYFKKLGAVAIVALLGALAIVLFGGCAASQPAPTSCAMPEKPLFMPSHAPRNIKAWPPEILTGIKAECMTEGSEPVCACYTWTIADRYTFFQLNAAVAAGKGDLLAGALALIFHDCERDLDVVAPPPPVEKSDYSLPTESPRGAPCEQIGHNTAVGCNMAYVASLPEGRNQDLAAYDFNGVLCAFAGQVAETACEKGLMKNFTKSPLGMCGNEGNFVEASIDVGCNVAARSIVNPGKPIPGFSDQPLEKQNALVKACFGWAVGANEIYVDACSEAAKKQSI